MITLANRRLAGRLGAPIAILFFVGLGGCSGCEGGGLQQRDAVLSVEPDPIVFDLIAARDRAVQRVRIINNGAANLDIHGDPIVEEYGDVEHPALSLRNVLYDCSEEPRPVDEPYRLLPGDCRTLEVVYSPRDVGETEGMLIFESNDDSDARENDGIREVPIFAEADAPEIEVCLTVSDCSDEEICFDPNSEEPLTLAFPLTQLDETRECGVRISNVGDMELSALGWGFSVGNRYRDFSLEPDDISDLVLETGGGVELSVVFSPVAGGERTGTINVSSNDPLKPQVPIEVVGLGDGPKICPHPMPVVEFGDVDVGDMKEENVALENCGTMPLQISDAWIQDATGRHNSEDYFFGPGAEHDATLAPGDELEIPIEFIPRYEGPVNGRLYFESNDPIVPQAFVTLTGNGTIPPSCEISPSTFNLSFGTAAIDHPTTRSLAVTNSGELPCNEVEGFISLGGGARFEHIAPSVNDQPFHLDPGDTVTFDLQYDPQQADLNHTGSFTIESPDLQEDVMVSLAGTSTAEPTCNLSVTPQASFGLMDECMSTPGLTSRVLQFGSVRTGNSETMTVSLENVGSADCIIESTELKDAMAFFPAVGLSLGTMQNRVLVNGNLTDTIRPGEVGTIDVNFDPDSEELSCGDLWIETNDTNESECASMWGGGGLPGLGDEGCYSIQLRGRGVRARVAAVPATLDFGLITIDCLSPERDVSLYNIGGADVTVTGISLAPDDGTFRLESVPPLPVNLPSGQQLTVSLTYAPTGSPTTHTGTLTFESDAENSPTVVELEGRSTHDDYQVDHFEQLEEPMVDVLWVIDDSCSMGDVQSNLRDNIHVFMQRAIDQNTDFHMGVITTDWDDPDKSGKLQGSPRIIDRDTPDPVQAFRDNADVGTSGHHIEKGFDAAFMALTDPVLSGHNAGFLRDEAKLAIIFVSDEEEQSEASVDFFVDFFRNIKGHRNDAMMAAHAIVGDHPGGCSNNYGSADPAPRYIEAADATGGLFRSICAPDWGQVADDMGLDAFAARREFFLTREPIPSSIQVQVDGSNVPSSGNWSYDAATNSIVFTTSSTPAQGSSITVSYDVLCREP